MRRKKQQLIEPLYLALLTAFSMPIQAQAECAIDSGSVSVIKYGLGNESKITSKKESYIENSGKELSTETDTTVTFEGETSPTIIIFGRKPKKEIVIDTKRIIENASLNIQYKNMTKGGINIYGAIKHLFGSKKKTSPVAHARKICEIYGK